MLDFDHTVHSHLKVCWKERRRERERERRRGREREIKGVWKREREIKGVLGRETEEERKRDGQGDKKYFGERKG